MVRLFEELGIALDQLRAQRQGPAGLARRREARLAAMLTHARTSSPFYRHLYRDVAPARPSEGVLLAQLPPVTKQELMANFDDWVTNPAVTRAGVEAFIADPSLVGTPFLGRYFVCTTSGTTGHPGIFVHDPRSLAVSQSFFLRVDLAWLSPRELLAMARRGLRWAAVVGTGGHYAGAGWVQWQRRRSRWRRRAFQAFPVQQPLAGLVAALNDFNPSAVTGYPSALALLAEEQLAGRLHLKPVVVELAGESCGPDVRARIAEAFGGAVHDAYAASEFTPLAFDCDRGWLHVNSDWAILEPVGADYAPTPPGEPSHTVLLTNLANRVQPIIRYDLGDSVLAKAGPCGCGSPLPAIRVAGRRDDVLRLTAADGTTVRILPLAIGSVVNETPGLHRSQLVQTAPATLRLRLEPEPGADAAAAWQAASAKLREYLAGLELGNVDVVRAEEPPEQSGPSGKFRQVIARVPE
ncbi:MAG: phenylacetate--CoA ligase family protein [Arthrobacter sp.]|nr:phenylacetate--CoA ligase family protein [Arthrobacter sp.]